MRLIATMRQIPPRSRQALYNVNATRGIEQTAQACLPAHTLMQRAGLAVAQLAMAIAPHARRIWIACGAGNNGGDGLEAAMHLQHWGKAPVVTWLGSPDTCPGDAAESYRRALASGVNFAQEPPLCPDLCIDALLGIGSHARPPQGQLAHWIHQINACTGSVLAIDVPTGLNADTGVLTEPSVKATDTLSLLTLKPGLFTASGRDAVGNLWLHELGGHLTSASSHPASEPTAWLAGAPMPRTRQHASHKGSYGDVAVIGGATGMTGAALLAASAALRAGAGRVFVGLLGHSGLEVDTNHPELMLRSIDSLDFTAMTVVCGCGGGEYIHEELPRIISTAAHVVIDADAINSIAKERQLQHLLKARANGHASTVLTPHPLEAARLLGTTAQLVQQDRMAAAHRLAQAFCCTVVLKGSGTVIAAPDQTPVINPTGNASLATAGTGDVLAGMVGAALASHVPAFEAACDSVYRHGLAADRWPRHLPMTASHLTQFVLR